MICADVAGLGAALCVADDVGAPGRGAVDRGAAVDLGTVDELFVVGCDGADVAAAQPARPRCQAVRQADYDGSFGAHASLRSNDLTL